MITPDPMQDRRLTLFTIEQFLYREARLLDAGAYEDWLTLFDDDVAYWMPIQATVARNLQRVDREALAIFENDKRFLDLWVRRLRTGLAHAEEPPSRTRHFVSNIEWLGVEAERVTIHCCVQLFQSRLESTDVSYFAGRTDVLRQCSEGWRICARTIVPDQRLLPRGISVLF